MGSPAIYVFDCCKAETILKWFSKAVTQRKRENNFQNNMIFDDYDEGQRAAAAAQQQQDFELSRDIIVLAACGENELLPTNPDLPADIFTACLTTPIKMALRWFCSRTALTGINIDLIDSIPGTVSDRRTPLGELNWIFTAVTDTIAWNVLPHHIFQKLFRQDLLVASLMRNYLLAERIMRSHDCTPVSLPHLPPTYQHPLWRAWDLAADMCISQLPSLIKNPKLFRPNPFFSDQLTAFEIWLEFASQKKERQPPEQLPIILQVLLSKQHRTKALELLSRFLDLGSWAVNYALSVGIFPYVLKLLQSPIPELRKILVSIWSKILALDSSCKQDLLKDSGHIHFTSIITQLSNDFNQRATSAFILSCMVNNYRQGQATCLNNNLILTCIKYFNDSNSSVRKWIILTIAKLWENYNDAKLVAIRENAHERLCLLLTDPVPEVRTAAIYALGNFIGGAGDNEDRQQIESNIGLTLFVVTADMSPTARQELIISLAKIIFTRTEEFIESVIEISKEELKMIQEIENRKKSKHRNLSSSSINLTSSSSSSLRSSSKPNLHGSVCSSIWKVILSLRHDPFPSCSKLAKKLVCSVFAYAAYMLKKHPIDLGSSYSFTLDHLINHLLKRSSADQRPTTPVQSRKVARQALLSPLRTVNAIRRQSSQSSLLPTFSSPLSSTNISDNFNLSVANTQLQQSTTQNSNNNSSNFGQTDNNSQLNNNNDNNISPPSNFNSKKFESKFFDWSFFNFTKPYKDPIDESSPETMERDWRVKRQTKYLEEIQSQIETAHKRKFDQISLMNDNETDVAGLMELHPSEPLCIVSDTRNKVSVWNWEDSTKIKSFSNLNSSSSRISCLSLANTQDQFMILMGSTEGVIRIWKNLSNDIDSSPKLVTAWRALSDSSSSNQTRGSGLVFDWNQGNGHLVCYFFYYFFFIL